MRRRIIKGVSVLMTAALFAVSCPMGIMAEDSSNAAVWENSETLIQDGVEAPVQDSMETFVQGSSENETEPIPIIPDQQKPDGSGTESSPYLISDAGDLIWINTWLASTDTSGLTDIYFKITSDIAFQSSDFAEGGAYYNEGRGFESIAFETFSGSGSINIDGGSHKISGLVINSDGNGVGLIGSAANMLKISDLKLENVNITGTNEYGAVGALVGSATSGAVISNCSVSGSVTSAYIAGGIIGEIQGWGVSGIAITNCENSASVTGNDTTGGITAHIYSGNGSTISGCSNTGTVSGCGSVGGIIGESFGEVASCINNGDVTAALEELPVDDPQSEVQHQYIQTNNFIGGIVGYNYGTVNKCVNSYAISGGADEYMVGGIAGNNSGSIIDSINEGGLSAYYYLGGITAENYGTIDSCVNTGNIKGLTDGCNIGGIAGSNCDTLGNCMNCGYISALSLAEAGKTGDDRGNAAGIAGYLNSTEKLSNCYNVGSIEADGTVTTGAIVANAAEDSNTGGCYYLENVDSGIGKNSGSGTAVKCSDADMKLKATYSGYNFDTVWTMPEEGAYLYPVLKNVDMNTANTAVALTLISEPDKVLYLVNTDELDTTGAVVRLRKKYGVAETIDVTPEMVTGFDKTTVGTKTLTVTCEGVTAEFKVKVVDGVPHVAYTTHVQNIGWQDYVADGAMAGTEGLALRLEAIKIKIEDNVLYEGGISYRTHIQNIGWEESFTGNDGISGTSGRAYRLEAIEIKLTGELAEAYDIYYRVHAQNVGWMGWAKNGARAGTAGYAYRLEGIEIRLVEKGGPSPKEGTSRAFLEKGTGFLHGDPDAPHVSYTTHVQNVGWQDYVSDGDMAGTEGLALRLEGIKIRISNAPEGSGIEYRTHIQNIGWEEEFTANNGMSGTEGLAYRLEAIEIRLTGAISEEYDVFYRVHAQNIGWMGWTSNGDRAGTAGYAYRLEGIEIRLMPKGDKSLLDEKKAFEDKYEMSGVIRLTTQE